MSLQANIGNDHFVDELNATQMDLFITHSHNTAVWVIRDENGTYHGSAQARGRRVHDALDSKMQTVLMALQRS